METPDTIIVIGAGAAGLLSAWQAALGGRRVILIEKNARAGIKIRISGGGKCNVTNGGTIDAMLKRFEKPESRFLRFAFHAFPNGAVRELLRQQGVETYVREDGKVFPSSHNADDVLDALLRLTTDAGVQTVFGAPVFSLIREASGSFIVTTAQERYTARSVIVATGGMSYVKTGTSGDGFRWLTALGHTVVPLRPALAPIELTPVPPPSLQGTPVRSCRLSAVSGTETIDSFDGDILYTHFGLSGPAALEISKKAFLPFEEGKRVEMAVDFLPGTPPDAVEQRLTSAAAEGPNRNLSTFIANFIPTKLAEPVLLQGELDGERKLHQFSRGERRRLASVLKRFIAGTVSGIPLDRGEVTAGGIPLNEVSPTTMESAVVPGLFICGEILDIAGPVGGYNLQAAFSTGYVAGRSAALR